MTEADAVLVHSTSSGELEVPNGPAEASEPAAPDTSQPTISEVTLSARARDGDVTAFEALLRDNQAELVRMAYRMLDDRGLARSVVVNTLEEAWRQVDGKPGSVIFRVEMSRLVMRRCLKVLADREKTAAADARETAPAAESGGDIDLAAALAVLPGGHRAAWVLKELHGLSDQDISFAIGVPSSKVNQSVSQARQQLITHVGSTAPDRGAEA